MRQSLEYFELQASFAAAVQRVLGVSAEESYRRFTTFYKIALDNDAGSPPARWKFDEDHPRWREFADAISGGADPAHYVWERSEWDFGGRCFEYDYWPEQRTVRIHFGNSPDGLALRAESIPARTAELQAMVAEVGELHSEAAFVRGASWLYHVPAYRRLFPPTSPRWRRSATCIRSPGYGGESFLRQVFTAGTLDSSTPPSPSRYSARRAPLTSSGATTRPDLADRHLPITLLPPSAAAGNRRM